MEDGRSASTPPGTLRAGDFPKIVVPPKRTAAEASASAAALAAEAAAARAKKEEEKRVLAEAATRVQAKARGRRGSRQFDALQAEKALEQAVKERGAVTVQSGWRGKRERDVASDLARMKGAKRGAAADVAWLHSLSGAAFLSLARQQLDVLGEAKRAAAAREAFEVAIWYKSVLDDAAAGLDNLRHLEAEKEAAVAVQQYNEAAAVKRLIDGARDRVNATLHATKTAPRRPVAPVPAVAPPPPPPRSPPPRGAAAGRRLPHPPPPWRRRPPPRGWRRRAARRRAPPGSRPAPPCTRRRPRPPRGRRRRQRRRRRRSPSPSPSPIPEPIAFEYRALAPPVVEHFGGRVGALFFSSDATMRAAAFAGAAEQLGSQRLLERRRGAVQTLQFMVARTLQHDDDLPSSAPPRSSSAASSPRRSRRRR